MQLRLEEVTEMPEPRTRLRTAGLELPQGLSEVAERLVLRQDRGACTSQLKTARTLGCGLLILPVFSIAARLSCTASVPDFTVGLWMQRGLWVGRLGSAQAGV